MSLRHSSQSLEMDFSRVYDTCLQTEGFNKYYSHCASRKTQPLHLQTLSHLSLSDSARYLFNTQFHFNLTNLSMVHQTE